MAVDRRPQTRLAVERLSDTAVHDIYGQKLSDELRTPTTSIINAQWDPIK